jgi:hypothetical protein
VGGDDEDRRLGVRLPEPPHHLDPVHRDHAEVGDHHVRGALAVGGDGLGAAAHPLHLVAEAGEREDHALAHRVVIVGDQDPGHASRSVTGSARPFRGAAACGNSRGSLRQFVFVPGAAVVT